MRGVHPSRLLLIPYLDMPDYRRLLSLSDIFLDTRNYNAHTVASDSLQLGLPVLTLTGIVVQLRRD